MQTRFFVGLGVVGSVGMLVVACGSSSSVGGSQPITQDASTPVDSSITTDAATPVDAAPKDAAPPLDAGVDAAPVLPVISSTVKATAVDLTGQEYGAPTPDGELDATVTAVINGAFDAILWVSTDAVGDAGTDSHEWDTIVLTEPLPDLGTPFTMGSQTWTTAVSSDGTTVLNDADGHVSVGAGTHTLTVSVELTAKFTTGQSFRLYVRQGTTWIAGPVFVW